MVFPEQMERRSTQPPTDKMELRCAMSRLPGPKNTVALPPPHLQENLGPAGQYFPCLEHLERQEESARVPPEDLAAAMAIPVFPAWKAARKKIRWPAWRSPTDRLRPANPPGLSLRSPQEPECSPSLDHLYSW